MKIKLTRSGAEKEKLTSAQSSIQGRFRTIVVLKLLDAGKQKLKNAKNRGAVEKYLAELQKDPKLIDIPQVVTKHSLVVTFTADEIETNYTGQKVEIGDADALLAQLTKAVRDNIVNAIEENELTKPLGLVVGTDYSLTVDIPANQPHIIFEFTGGDTVCAQPTKFALPPWTKETKEALGNPKELKSTKKIELKGVQAPKK